MKRLVVSTLLTLLTLNANCNKMLFKRTVPLGSEPWANFIPVSEYPVTCKSVITCAGFTGALAKNKLISPNAMDYVNAFKWIDGVCTAGKVLKDNLFEWPNRDLTESPGLHLHQGCYVDQEPKSVTESVLFLADLLFYYPAYGDSEIAYYSSTLAQMTEYYQGVTMPSYGHTFINGRTSLFRSTYKYFKFDFPEYKTLESFSASVWYHGRGVVATKKAVFSTIRTGSWSYDHMTMYAGTYTNPGKAVWHLRDANVEYQIPSLQDIPNDRWTHLAGTYDATTKLARVYVNGMRANDPKSVNVGNLYRQNIVYVGFRGKDQYICNCDVAELEIYKRMLTDEEVYQIYSKFLTGSDCP